jgi:hypothetical protein
MKRLTDFSEEDDILSSDHKDAPGNVAIGVTHVYPVTHTRSRFLGEPIGKNTVKKVLLLWIHDTLVLIRIRIRILLISSLTFKMPTKNKFF